MLVKCVYVKPSSGTTGLQLKMSNALRVIIKYMKYMPNRKEEINRAAIILAFPEETLRFWMHLSQKMFPHHDMNNTTATPSGMIKVAKYLSLYGRSGTRHSGATMSMSMLKNDNMRNNVFSNGGHLMSASANSAST